MLTEEIKKYIDKSVLCWLATCNKDGEPNVSPKEMFTWQDEQTLLIAHIASPNSVANIRNNPNVCVSFVDVFVQKGFKLKGRARIIEKEHAAFPEKVKHLTDLFSDAYPIKDVIEVAVTKAEPIVAPSYFLFPETTEERQIAAAHKTYKVRAAE